MKTLLLVVTSFFTAYSFCQINQVDANGKKQGTWKKAYENNAVYRYVGQFKDDKPYGKFVYYYESGNVEAVIEFSDDGSIAYSKMYHESGYMMARGKYVNQQKDSTWVYFDDRGVISYQESYVSGKLDGLKIIYYEPVDGQYIIARYYTYKDGILHGEFKTYHPNLKIESEGSYENGNLHGTVKHYYPNGNTLRIERYQYAVKHGYWIFYDEKGVQVGYKLYWEGVQLKGDALAKKEAELKSQRDN